MTNRKLCHILKDQKPVVLSEGDPIQRACQVMRDRGVGSALVVDGNRQLKGIFTGRDAVRAVARGMDASSTALADVMTRNPVTVTPDQRAIDALRKMSEGGFRHVPVVEGGRIWGIVSRGDLKGMEIDLLDDEEHLAECIR